MIISPFNSLLGGSMVGLSAAFYHLIFGRVLGISGIYHYITKDFTFRLSYLAGLVASGFLFAVPTSTITSNPVKLATAGLLVGFGTALGSGCTSGHGLCGIARSSKRSIVAVASFMLSAMVTRFFTEPDVFTTIAPTFDWDIPPLQVLLSLLGLFGVAFTSSKWQNKLFWRDVFSFMIGIFFGYGLIKGGMADTSRALNFLSFFNVFAPRPEGTFPIFDPSLAIMMAAGIIPNLIGNYIQRHLEKPVLLDRFEIPTRQDITWELVVGSSVFGIGWGMVGLCPGPAFVSLSHVFKGDFTILEWFAGFATGSYLHKKYVAHCT
ncbi:hypothetical protein HK103_001347 [Boothiomyces macroporosus]|uniref:Sulphur transport domain-containing protein n=1 Tax=Boothiomyces macroporosus TaxID=261099 RepID=A0AAD5UEB2_9FUNG|nr:hypothetical protein HK103_001347 [Boothiomyces macroporosus]